MNPHSSKIIYLAAGTACSLALGGRLIPRLLWPHAFNASYPPIPADIPADLCMALTVTALVAIAFATLESLRLNGGAGFVQKTGRAFLL